MRDLKFLYKDGQALTGKLVATGVTSNTITSSGADWASNQFIAQTVRIISGTGTNTIGRIISNNVDTITIQAWSSTQPTTGDEFIVENPNYENKNKFYYGFRNEIIKGRDKLIQDIVKDLLTQIGSNLYNPDQGNDFMKKIFERSYSIKDTEELSATMGFAISNIKQKIIKQQTNRIINGDPLTDSEILVDITINKLEYNKELFFWDAELFVETKAGTTILGI
jgi:hypothetical protein